MTYARVAIAAIRRYRMEAPYRALYREKFPKKKRSLGFGLILATLAGNKVIPWKEVKELKYRYKTLSNILHGNPV